MDTPNPATRRPLNVAAQASISEAPGGATISVLDPSTERVLAAVPDATLEDAFTAVEAAAKAAPGWAATAPRARSEILRRCFELMTERSEELAELISLETARPPGTRAARLPMRRSSFVGTRKRLCASGAISPWRRPARTGS